MVVIAQRLIPGGMALVSGLTLGFIFSSGALGLLYTGPIAETYGFPLVLTITTGLVLAGAPLALMLKDTETKLIQRSSQAASLPPET
jgi:FSR family fosmidomycin resistance protein-like MFS transporter